MEEGRFEILPDLCATSYNHHLALLRSVIGVLETNGFPQSESDEELNETAARLLLPLVKSSTDIAQLALLCRQRIEFARLPPQWRKELDGLVALAESTPGCSDDLKDNLVTLLADLRAV